MQSCDGINIGGILLGVAVIWLLSADRDSTPRSVHRFTPSPTATSYSDTPLDADAIGSMKDGDSGWAVPWALSLNDGMEGINKRYMYHAESGGTVDMRIEKIGDTVHAWPMERERLTPWNGALVIPASIHWPTTAPCGKE